jgi:O-antigen biosynthesis protein
MKAETYREAYLEGLDTGAPPEVQPMPLPAGGLSRARCHGPASSGGPPISLCRRTEVLDVLARTLPRSVHDMDAGSLERWLADRRGLEERVEDLDGQVREARRVLDETRQALDDARWILKDRERFIERVTRSPSLRIGMVVTAPVRLLRPVLSDLRKVPHLFRQGGLGALARNGWKRGERDGNVDYQVWLQRHGHPDAARRAAMARRWPELAHQPLISVLMPVYNTDPGLLDEAVQSVLAQVYTRWELVIADDASDARATRAALERIAGLDPRVKVIHRSENGHISEASNTALEEASGEWVGLLDHDDLLAPDALYWMVEEINAHPDCGFIYSDEDKISETGARRDPCFKPDWNPDLLRSQNYINHFSLYRGDLLRQAGGFRAGFEGAQDYDLVLRVTEGLEAARIRHVPRVLYHWRAVPASTASAGSAKPYAAEAARRALAEHLARSGHGDAAVLPAPGFEGVWWRVRYPLPAHPPRVSIIMPTRNGLDLLLDSVSGVLDRTDYPDVELIIVDNGSDDPATLRYLDYLADARGVQVIRDDRPFNYSQLNNSAVAHASGSVLVLMNNDIKVINRDWLREMVSHVLRPEVGLVGARLSFPDDRLQHAGCVLGVGGVAAHAFLNEPRGAPGYFGRAALIQNYSALTAACVAVRKSVFEEVGGLNESDLRIAFNDMDLCLRILDAGYRNVWTPHADLYHVESASRGYEDTPEKQARFRKEIQYMRKQWGPRLDSDPAYNPNLTLTGDPFGLAVEPRLAPDPWTR